MGKDKLIIYWVGGWWYGNCGCDDRGAGKLTTHPKLLNYLKLRKYIIIWIIFVGCPNPEQELNLVKS